MKRKLFYITLIILLIILGSVSIAQNPVVTAVVVEPNTIEITTTTKVRFTKRSLQRKKQRLLQRRAVIDEELSEINTLLNVFKE